MIRRTLASAFISLALSSPAFCATDEHATLINQRVRLTHTTVGCPSAAALSRIAKTLMTNGEDAVLNAMNAEGCQFYTTMRGEVIDVNAFGSAACVLSLGNTRCLWFGITALEPVR